MSNPRKRRTVNDSAASRAAKLRDVESPKFTAAQEALMSAVLEEVGDDASFADFEETMLAVSNEIGRRIAKKKSSK